MNDTPQIPETDNRQERKGNCPACGYFAGVVSTCVRCGARTGKNISIKTVQTIAVIGSIAGILLLWAAAYMKIAPEIKIGDIGETMNNALVSIEGTVTAIDYRENDNSFRLTVNDGTGQMRINSFNRLSDFRGVHGDRMPSIRDRVRITGTLNISQAWGNSMFLTIPERIQVIEDYIVVDKKIKDITAADAGNTYWIQGSVHSYQEFPTRGGGILRRINISDGTGTISLPLFDSQYDELPEALKTALMRRGTKLRMSAGIGVFRDEPQLEISDPGDPGSIVILN